MEVMGGRYVSSLDLEGRLIMAHFNISCQFWPEYRGLLNRKYSILNGSLQDSFVRSSLLFGTNTAKEQVRVNRWVSFLMVVRGRIDCFCIDLMTN